MNDFLHFMCPICREVTAPVLSFAACMHKVCKACAIHLGWDANSARVMACPTCQRISRLLVDHAVTQTVEDWLRTTATPGAAPDAQRGDAASTTITVAPGGSPSRPSVDQAALRRLTAVMDSQLHRFAVEVTCYEAEMLDLLTALSLGLVSISTAEIRQEGEAPLDLAGLGAMASRLSRYRGRGRAADEIRAVRDAIRFGINALCEEREEYRAQRDLEQAQRAAARGRLLAARREAADRGDAPSSDARPQ